MQGVPGNIKYVLIIQAVKDAVAAEHQEIVEVRLHRELADLGLRNNNPVFTSILRQFGFYIYKGSGY